MIIDLISIMFFSFPVAFIGNRNYAIQGSLAHRVRSVPEVTPWKSWWWCGCAHLWGKVGLSRESRERCVLLLFAVPGFPKGFCTGRRKFKLSPLR